MAKQDEEYGWFKTFAIAIVCAVIFRSFFYEPFYIPSSSMKPNLLIGDYVFVSKYSYGYSRYSFPFGLNIFSGRVLSSEPKRGDVVVFRLPSNPKINYIKRIVGLPGDTIQMEDGVLYVNDQRKAKIDDGKFFDRENGRDLTISRYIEKITDQKDIKILDQYQHIEPDNTGIYRVPKGHYFVMGDNRDNSRDSRFLNEVGYIPAQNLVGRAEVIFFSNQSPNWQFWNWPTSIRFNRVFSKIY